MIKGMSGVRRECDLPVLKSGECCSERHGEYIDISPGICEGAQFGSALNDVQLLKAS
jgi:hypothetical protein